ncbi:hypothetical protein AHAS_Ahas01G0112300 [Arachis hypogaea]
MIAESPFSSLDHATSFARQLWFKESRIQSWLDAFSGQSHLYRAISHAPGPMMRVPNHLNVFRLSQARYENTLVVELDIAAQDEFKLIEHRLERLWERLTFSQIQEASEAAGEVVPDSEEKEDVVPSGGSEEADSAGQNASMLSYDLNKTPKENDYPYSGMSPEEKNAWHLAMWATRYLNP